MRSIWDCPTGCGGQRTHGHVMCSPCWRQVPHRLKKELHDTWRLVEQTSTQSAYDDYDRVRNQAIASVK
jgi:hypothetical protein